MNDYPKEFLDLLESVKAKRPRTVIQHILEHGYITSEELKDTYGYNHPPRAVRDVREYGIPLITYHIMGSDGRRIAAYKFGNPADMKNNQGGGIQRNSALLFSAPDRVERLGALNRYGSFLQSPAGSGGNTEHACFPRCRRRETGKREVAYAN